MSFAPRPQPESVGPGQESVWDYPRPPALDASGEHVEVFLGGRLIAVTDDPIRVLETSHPPTYYLPRAAFVDGSLRSAPGNSFCEFKGDAAYLDLVAGVVVASGVAWFYPQPSPGYESLLDHLALYPGRMDRCTVDGELVRPQPGEFYGGWITDRVAGPFKGSAGSRFW
ncbi:MAG: DUF427 domain-containing protein [Nakamurella sp.]